MNNSNFSIQEDVQDFINNNYNQTIRSRYFKEYDTMIISFIPSSSNTHHQNVNIKISGIINDLFKQNIQNLDYQDMLDIISQKIINEAVNIIYRTSLLYFANVIVKDCFEFYKNYTSSQKQLSSFN